MNKARRKELEKAVALIQDAVEIIEACKDEEEEAYENLPEGIQNGERGDQMSEYISILEDAVEYINEQADNITVIIES